MSSYHCIVIISLSEPYKSWEPHSQARFMAVRHQQVHFEIHFDISLITRTPFNFDNIFILNFKNHKMSNNAPNMFTICFTINGKLGLYFVTLLIDFEIKSNLISPDLLVKCQPS